MSNSPYSGAALKRSAMHFLVGKAVSALLNLGILLWLVRLLAVEEYGAYVALVAGMELALAVISIGLPWVAARYLPEFRLYANGKQLSYFVWKVIAWICLFALTGALLLFIAMPWLLVPLKLAQQTDVARLYLLVLVFEGLRRNIQECILEPLLQQGQAQFSQVVRNLGLVLCLGVVANQGIVHLQHVVLAELLGTITGTLTALHGLVRHLHSRRSLAGKDDWQPPSWPEMWRTARHMYFSHLITLIYSQQVFIFLTQRFLGVESTALFGFLLNLYGQICRYLPAILLFSLIRPKLIASYLSEGGMTQLTRNANLVGKISLFVLMPLLVFTWLAGGEFLTLLSGGKFIQSGYYLGGLLLALIPFSQRQILETVSVACGQSYLCSWGSSLGVLALPLAYFLFEAGLGLWSPILAMFLGQIFFNATLISAMAFTTTYRPDTTGFFKLMVSALVVFVLAVPTIMAYADLFENCINSVSGLFENLQCIVSGYLGIQFALSKYGWLGLTVTALFACVLYLLVAYFLKPFRLDERVRLNLLLKCNIFVW